MKDGIPAKVLPQSIWFNVRQKLFTRKRKRGDDLGRYGGSDNCNKFGDAKGWRGLLEHMNAKRLGRWDEEKAVLLMRKFEAGRSYLDHIRVHRDVLDLYNRLEW